MEKMYPYEIINILRKGESNAHIAKISMEIEELQKKFADTDYKTTKNLQYEKMGLEAPYDWNDIYTAAEAIRKQIREKEAEMNNLLALKGE
jgi:hypothetical protein